MLVRVDEVNGTVRFTWDAAKKVANARKHGVSFEEAIQALCDELAKTVLDLSQPAEERRYISVGETFSGRLITVGFADYGDVIRLVTARMATKRERRDYEDEA